jgi:hypothetical protein
MDSYLVRLRKELEDVLADATGRSLTQAPPGKWNSGQILEHLFLSYKGTNRGLARCLEKGAPLATQATLRHRLQTLVVVTVGYMPDGVKAPQVAVPCGVPSEEVRSTIIDEIRTMESGLDECERRFGPWTKIMDHPILGPLTADQWRKLHWVHGRHHAKQIRERRRV